MRGDKPNGSGGYHNKQGGPIPGGHITEEGMQVDYRIDYDKRVDVIVVNYAEWSYLQLMRMVDIKCYDHLKLIPKSLMSSNEFVSKVVWTILNTQKKLHYR